MAYLNPATQSLSHDEIERQPALPSSLSIPPPQAPEPGTKFGLKAKMVLMAIAFGAIPVMVIGAIAYQVTATHVTRQITLAQQARTNHLATMLEEYITCRKDEAISFASSTIFTNPNVIDRVTLNQKKAALNTFQEQSKFYDNIAYLDLQGNPLFQSRAEFPLVNNLSDRQYFQQAIATKQAVMNEISKSPSTGEVQMEFAVPVKNGWTDEVIGVMYLRVPSEQIKPVFMHHATKDEQWHLLDTNNTIVASAEENLINKPVANYAPQLQVAHAAKQTAAISVERPQSNEQKEQLVDYAPVKVGAINPRLNLGTAIAVDKDIALASLQPLRWIFLGGTIGTTLLVSSIAGLFVNRLLQPLSSLSAAVEKLKQGKLDTRVKLKGQDEIAVLGARLDEMAKQLDHTVQHKKDQANNAELIANISQARSSRELQMPLSLFLTKVRRTIATDRVTFCQFDRQWQGTMIAESVALDFPRTLGIQFDDHYFTPEDLKRYQAGGIQAFADLNRANLKKSQLQQLKLDRVKAGLALPVILLRPTAGESEKLVGLLIVHQCSSTRVWQQSDIDYLQQITYQLATILNGYYYQKHENCQKIDFKKNVAQVASSIEQMSHGNLAINLSDLGQSDLAKSLDTVVSDVRQTLAKVKVPATKINSQLATNKQDMAQLQENLRQQAHQLGLTFSLIEQIVSSTTEVSFQAGLASEAVGSVVKNIELEQANFVQAVTFMSELKAYLHNNTHKVKHLNSASQKMTRVIDSIRKINLRASLLASKLSSRIPQIGDSAFGLQEEIESIQQSIAATKELEGLVRSIDSEISGVLQDYSKSSNILKQEKDIVANVSRNLKQIVKTTKTAQQHLFSLTHTAETQIQTAQTMRHLKSDLKQTSESAYTLSDRTLNSLEKTAITAKDLKNVLNFFKLDPA